jgi:MFS family permease
LQRGELHKAAGVVGVGRLPAIANVALRHIAGSLGADVDESTWIVTTYLIASAAIIPVSGWLSSVVGRKRFYMGCVAIFTVASVLCGFAPSLALVNVAGNLGGSIGISMARTILAQRSQFHQSRLGENIYADHQECPD